MGSVAGFGQSALPLTSPTTAATPAAGAASAGATAGATAAHRASVVYAGGKLEVTADNSSLNQILRDIARETGMKITGGLNDERVFGKYGPAGAAEVLAKLLDGADTNMLLKENADKVPAELILTPRGGGPTPPNPNAPGFNDDSDRDAAEEAQQQELEQERQRQLQQQASPANLPVAGANGTPPANPVRTPQEIYRQLQQLQQQQHQQQPANPQ